MKTISKLENHYIICGYGRMGAVIANELKAKNQKFLIIENNEKKVEIVRERGMIFKGDATSEDTLFKAQIIEHRNCRGVRYRSG